MSNVNEFQYADARLAGLLRRYLRKHWHPKLKGVVFCGSKLQIIPGRRSTVFVTANEQSARFSGLATCHSPWCCPVCSPKVMAEKGAEIACLIDALAKQYKLYAFMVTFTLPHTYKMTCEEAFKVLTDTWRMFMRPGKRAKNSQNKSLGVLGEFRNKFDIQHFARVYEFTWGFNGWHPHIHVLFWTKKENFKDLLEYEDKLTDKWFSCALHCHKKLNLQSEEELEKIYADYKRRPVTGHRAVYFSRDKRGGIRPVSSSHYISGWGGDCELANSIKGKHSQFEGHYSPFEMLQEAETATDAKTKLKWLNLFREYAIATRGHKRVQFSPNDQKIIKAWKLTNDYITLFKKKFMDKGAVSKVVFWFSEQQWRQICAEELCHDYGVKNVILHLARAAPHQIPTMLFEIYHIDCRQNSLEDPRVIEFQERHSNYATA